MVGTYQKGCGLVNNRSYWTQIDRVGKTIIAALWIGRYDGSREWDWIIGLEKRLGTNRGGVYSSHEAARPAACPTSTNRFKYVSEVGQEQPSAPANSVFIQCV